MCSPFKGTYTDVYRFQSRRIENPRQPTAFFCAKGIVAEIEGYDVPVADLKRVAEQIKLNSVAGMRE